MRFLVTAGPTCEPLDQVRRLTNFSTGRLGVELANFLAEGGHEVIALRSEHSTYMGDCVAKRVQAFSTTDSLLQLFRDFAREPLDAVFHAAAVSDFQFGTVYARKSDGSLEALTSSKFSTRAGTLLVELRPTPKLIGELRTLYPPSVIAGWKYEVEGTREEAIALGRRQIAENKTNLSVVNGPAYGAGYGIVSAEGSVQHCTSATALYEALLASLVRRSVG